jgi:hypothetical protein
VHASHTTSLGASYLDVLPISRSFLVKCLNEALLNGVVVEYKIVKKVETRRGCRPAVVFEDGGRMKRIW